MGRGRTRRPASGAGLRDWFHRTRRPSTGKRFDQMEPQPEPEPEPEPEPCEMLVPVLSQKTDAVQQLCLRWGFGPPSAKSIRAPCGLVALSVARWLASPPVAEQLTAACSEGGGGLETVLKLLAPAQTEELLLPLLERTCAEVLPAREEYIATHAEEFKDEDARESYRRGLVGGFEVSVWLQQLGSHAAAAHAEPAATGDAAAADADGAGTDRAAGPVSAPIGFLRHVQCGSSDANRKRFWSDFNALDLSSEPPPADAAIGADSSSNIHMTMRSTAAAASGGAMAIERDYVRQEGLPSQGGAEPQLLQCQPGSVDFLVETIHPITTVATVATNTGTDTDTSGLGQGQGQMPALQTIDEWVAAERGARARASPGGRRAFVFVMESELHRGNKTRHHYYCSWGHYSVLLLLLLNRAEAEGEQHREGEEMVPTLLLLDSMPVDDLPTAQGKAFWQAYNEHT